MKIYNSSRRDNLENKSKLALFSVQLTLFPDDGKKFLVFFICRQIQVDCVHFDGIVNSVEKRHCLTLYVF